MIIRFFSTCCTSEQCISCYLPYAAPEALTGLSFTCGDDYTHAILINTAMPSNLLVPKENVLGLAHEPPEFLAGGRLDNADIDRLPEFFAYVKKHVGRYYIGGRNYGPPFVPHHAFIGYCTPPTDETVVAPAESNRMSIIFSKKAWAPGHAYRHKLVEAILQSDLPIDIYGRGCEDLKVSDPRIKGAFTDSTLPYKGYAFTIAIENYKYDHYITEKLVSPLLYGCTVLYWGGLSPCGGVWPLLGPGNHKTDMSIIRGVLANPQKYRKKLPAPRDIMNQHCLLAHVQTLWGDSNKRLI